MNYSLTTFYHKNEEGRAEHLATLCKTLRCIAKTII
jgi:hypothetical protein